MAAHYYLTYVPPRRAAHPDQDVAAHKRFYETRHSCSSPTAEHRPQRQVGGVAGRQTASRPALSELSVTPIYRCRGRVGDVGSAAACTFLSFSPSTTSALPVLCCCAAVLVLPSPLM